jgi:hypothetical protein
MFPQQDFVIGSIGYLVSPAGQENDQKIHVDYNDKTVRHIFIPLVDLSSKNSTQFMKIIPPSISLDKLLLDEK